MIKEQFDILQKCIDLGVAKDIDVHYNTNGTQFPEQALENIWPHFKRIELAVSIDDIHKRFEYQRTNAKWDEVNQNILKFKDSGLQNLKIHICTTINFFNIMYIDELAQHVQKWDPEFWFINVLSYPEEFDIQQFKKTDKIKIIEKIKDCTIYKNEIKQAINYLSNDPVKKDPDIDKKRRWKIKAIDNIRKENFKTVFPDLNNLVKIYE
jgi:molybdenum cofactor biosynthesis enzyme MoaA